MKKTFRVKTKIWACLACLKERGYRGQGKLPSDRKKCDYCDKLDLCLDRDALIPPIDDVLN